MNPPTYGAVEEITSVWYGGAAAATAVVKRGPVVPPLPSLGASTLLPGTLLAGRYRLEQSLGEGAFARVYAAWDSALHRWVAAKISPSATGGQLSAGEAQLQAACQHPNLMPLYDAGSDPLLGVAYIIMPLYPGSDLAATLNRYGPMPFRTALLCTDQVCSALEFLQQRRNAVHGDIKPANIWLTNSGAALLMDFNLYGLLTQGDCLRAGTPGYTAPEALMGRMDARSDVFSLACVLYQCLAGSPPFTDDAAVQAGQFTPLRRLRPDLRPELEAVIHRALARQPEQRFQSAREFQTALRRPDTAGLEGRIALNTIFRTLMRIARQLGRMLAAVYRLTWRMLTKFLRHAVHRPLPALIEAVVFCILSRAALDMARQAGLYWWRLHQGDVKTVAWGALSLGVVSLVGTIAKPFLTRRNAQRRAKQ